MSYLKHYQSDCGRLVKRPKSKNVHDESEDEDHLPMQTQIDNLRAKISLKQRYNKALQEEYTESHQGAHQMIHELLTENEILRHDRHDALHFGNAAAVKALRNNRTFLLAMRGRTPEEVLGWLDDQIGDQRKLLDLKLDKVEYIKCRLSEAERMVVELEEFPFPGSSPWEQEFIEDFTRLGVAIADQEALRDCVRILGNRYNDILTDLRSGKDKWPYIVKKLDTGYKELKKELDGLQSMLNDAKRLKKNTYYRLLMTEKEYSENRKIRHHRLVKIRKMCEKEMRKNRKKYRIAGKTEKRESEVPASRTRSKNFSEQHSRIVRDERNAELVQLLERKRERAEEFEERARTLVNAMRVPDLRHCPHRIRTVYQLYKILKEEQAQKEVQLKVFLDQRNNLLLIKNHLYYTGCAEFEIFEHACEDKRSEISELHKSIAFVTEKLNRIGDKAVTLHTSCIGLIRTLQEGKKLPHKMPSDYLTLGRIVQSKIKTLAAAVKELESKFSPDDEPEKNYALFIKQTIPRESCRLGTLRKARSDDESSDDDDTAAIPSGFGSDRVLSREDIKARSNKIYAQGMLRKGFQDGSIMVKKGDRSERLKRKRSKKVLNKNT